MNNLMRAYIKQELEKLLEDLGFTLDEDESGFDKLSVSQSTTYVHPEGFEVVITESFNTKLLNT